MIRLLVNLTVSWALSAAALAAPAIPTTTPPTPEQLAAREKIRPKVEAIWTDCRGTADPDKDYVRYFWEITDRLIALGPDVIPFLTSEVDLADPATYHFAAYALGHFPGPESEAALKKAIRSADARGGRYGEACKRFATFSLALLGDASVLDSLQNGLEIQDGNMVPDLILIEHLAAILGPAGTPVLTQQLATYQDDPEAIEKLEFTILALGRTGDTSLVPKLVPYLKNPVADVRAQAAEAVSRLGGASACQEFVPLIASSNRREAYAAMDAIVRTKPEACYKALVARLEVEENIEIRSSLYGVVVALGGENALEILRAGVQSKSYVERSIVADMIGRVGSKKGLNLLRALVQDPNEGVADRAVGALEGIGGEGATDTLVALTADRRRMVSLTACAVLTQMNVTAAAPRVASVLMELVREPIGDLELRAQVAQLTDALVSLRYTDPIEDLKKAIDIQTDKEIKDSLASCVKRLSLLAKNGNDPAPWTEALASSDEAVRRLAARRLAEIGAPPAVAAIEARLAKPDLGNDERTEIFRSIAEAKTQNAASLVERALADPADDTWERRDARGEEAWAARRIGGDRMAKALRASALRREGRDWPTIVYLAIMEKSAASDTLKTLSRTRLRRPENRIGREDKQITEILADLAAGRTPSLYDVPPDALERE
ncbi:MAG TPA: HEAT repeat domain-containing protein [Candidatus Polarisedimenticolaceae bacterium]|nr:HEAT repeat domain-containing protein [Candidatus Polarisedimenticolaceae bacterium]